MIRNLRVKALKSEPKLRTFLNLELAVWYPWLNLTVMSTGRSQLLSHRCSQLLRRCRSRRLAWTRVGSGLFEVWDLGFTRSTSDSGFKVPNSWASGSGSSTLELRGVGCRMKGI